MKDITDLRKRIDVISKSVLKDLNVQLPINKPFTKPKNMKTNEETKLENQIESKIKLGIEGVYGRKNFMSPLQVIREHPAQNPNPYVLPWPSFVKSMNVYAKHCIWNFYKPKQAYLKVASKKIKEFEDFAEHESISKIIEDYGVPALDIIKEMEETQQPIRVVGDVEIRQACLLVHARINFTLMKKHYFELPNGDELLAKYTFHYDDLCSSLKVTRTKTRAIKKNNLNQSNVEQSNSEK